MTEENRTANPNNPGEESQSSPPIPKMVRRTYVIAFMMLGLTLIDAAGHYSEFGAWQILADGAGVLVGTILLGFSYFQRNRGKEHASNNLIAFTIFAAYIPGDIFLKGVTGYNIISGVILFVLTYFIFKPKNSFQWIQYAIIHVVASGILSLTNFVDRFDVSSSQAWTISLPVTTTAIAILMLWQVFTNLQIRTIRTRLLLIFMGIGLIPVLLVNTISTTIGFQQDLNQAQNSLNTAADLKSEQINTWRRQLDTAFNNLQQNSDFVENINQYIVVYSTDSFYIQIYRQDILNILSTYTTGDSIFTEISIADLNGEIIVSTNSSNERVNFSNNTLFQSGIFENYNAPLSFNPGTGQVEFSISQPLYNSSNQLIAVMIGKANTSALSTLVQQSLDFAETDNSYLVSKNYEILTQLSADDTFSLGSPISLPFSMENIATAQGQAETYRNITDTPVIGVSLYLPSLGVFLIEEQSQAEAFQTRQLNLIINGGLTILTFIAIVISSFRAARNISTPLSKLSNDAAQVTRKELNLIEPIDRLDEIGELSESLSAMTSELVQTTTNLESLVAERTKVLERRATYLETTSEISKALTGIYNLDDLLNTVSFLISENFGFYHVGIFLIDDQKEYAELKASNSEGGWRMLARNHKLKVGEQGIVGFVTGSGLPRVQQQVEGEESVHYNNPDLPLTKSEMALPFKAGNEIFGALDVQSTEEAAFSDEDVSALQVLADAVAVAIQNTRLVQQLQESLETERKIYGELTSSSWRSLLTSASSLPAFKSDQYGVQAAGDSASTLSQRAAATGEIQISPAKEATERHLLALPVSVRGGTVVAVIDTHKPYSAGPWTSEEITILESVSTELGLAIENARLFEETQRTAQRERISANLSSKIWASADVENILQTAVRELGSALNISHGTIKLRLPDEPESNGNSDGVEQQ